MINNIKIFYNKYFFEEITNIYCINHDILISNETYDITISNVLNSNFNKLKEVLSYIFSINIDNIIIEEKNIYNNIKVMDRLILIESDDVEIIKLSHKLIDSFLYTIFENNIFIA